MVVSSKNHAKMSSKSRTSTS